MQKALLIFIKNPVLGKVKTRLAKTVGPYNALNIYQYLLEHTMEITYELDQLEKFIYYDEFVPAKDEWPSSKYHKELQEGGNLGEKMLNAFKKAFNEGCKKVVLMMPDCPKMTDTMVEKAFKVLDTNDLVIGPTNDGGFYAIGMKEMLPDNILRDKAYSTSHVFEDVVKEIERQKKSWFKLPPLVDVDMEEDLGKLSKMIKKE